MSTRFYIRILQFQEVLPAAKNRKSTGGGLGSHMPAGDV